MSIQRPRLENATKRLHQLIIGHFEQSVSRDQAGDESSVRIILGIGETQAITNEVDASDDRVILVQ